MTTPTNEKKIFILLLLFILLSVLSYTIHRRVRNREGFGIFKAIGKIFKFLAKIGDFFCWLGDVVAWVMDTIAAILYYIKNLFSGCIMFYWFDMVVGTIWYLLYIIFSIVQYGKEYVKISNEVSKIMDDIDKNCYEFTGIHIFKYSTETDKKCYKKKIRDFPKWPF